jgi:hypothetical protein
VVHFDRLLWPEPAALESLRIFTGLPRNRVGVSSIAYDLLDRTVTYRLSSALAAHTLYRVELPGHLSNRGPRAFDGAGLAPGPVPLAFSFFTAEEATPAETPPPGATPSCDDAVELLGTHCGSANCHGGTTPAMGLGLDTREALLATALRKVAHQTETAATFGVAQSHPARFGTAMPILDPGNAANSYLVYKLLIADLRLPECNDELCERFQGLAGPERCEPLSADERERLRNWFVRGEPMPPNDPPTSPRPLDCASVRALVRFVDAGANCE